MHKFRLSTSDVSDREEMAYDAVIIGAGPAGLASAIHLKQLNPERSVCLVEKGSEIGAHVVSGAVIEPTSLTELLPDWKEKGAPLHTKVTDESLLFLRKTWAIKIPFIRWLFPQMSNEGNFIVSLGNLCRWLGEQAEALGVEIYPGVSGHRLYLENNCVAGVLTGDMGLDRNEEPGPNHIPGILLRSKQIILSEGARGSLSEEAIHLFDLRKNASPPTYGLGIKELWEIPPENHRPGLIQHSFGWPLDDRTYGGAFLYHFGENLVSYGFITGLDYRNPHLSPFGEMQRTKTHPAFSRHLRGGKRLVYGARVISEGGWQSLPKLSFPGGVLTGDSAGFLNMPKIKGIHTAIKSGILAAEAVHTALEENLPEAASYRSLAEKSWLGKELWKGRNIRPAFSHWGNFLGAIYSFFDSLILRGHAPWTLRHLQEDRQTLRPAGTSREIAYPRPDNVLTFDRNSSVFLSNIAHEENQPLHLKLKDREKWRDGNWAIYREPARLYCPAAVYEVTDADGKNPDLRINGQNCIHCKTCDIKDPADNLLWTPPEGGSGPNYPPGM